MHGITSNPPSYRSFHEILDRYETTSVWKRRISELYDKNVQLKMPSADGKTYATDAVNVETLFRIVQSIPSPKAENFKRWLAKVGYERIQVIQDPEISVKRAMLNWKIKGVCVSWLFSRTL